MIFFDTVRALQDLRKCFSLSGKRIHVQISKSRPRGAPEEEEYPPPPGRGGYYPHYPGERPEPPYRGRMPGYPLPPPPMPPPTRRAAYSDRGYGEGEGYGVVDFYEKYRARPYGAAGYDDSHAIPPPPPPTSMVRERLGMGSVDPYDQRTVPPPPPPPPPPSYMTRDRSPIRRTPLPPAPPPAGNGFTYERSRLSPMPRAPMYAPPHASSYSERLPPPPPPPPPPRYTGY